MNEILRVSAEHELVVPAALRREDARGENRNRGNHEPEQQKRRRERVLLARQRERKRDHREDQKIERRIEKAADRSRSLHAREHAVEDVADAIEREKEQRTRILLGDDERDRRQGPS